MWNLVLKPSNQKFDLGFKVRSVLRTSRNIAEYATQLGFHSCEAHYRERINGFKNIKGCKNIFVFKYIYILN